MLINEFLFKDPFLFEADKGNTGDGGQDDGDTSNDDADTGGNEGGTSGDEPKFSQIDVDRLLGERAKRAEKAAVKSLLQELGLSDVNSLKTTLQAHQAAQEAQKTDLQRAQEERDREKASREQLEAKYKRERIDRVIERQARGMEFAETAIADVTLLIDRSEIDEDDSGQIKGVNAALEALLEAKPHLKKQQARGDAPDLDGDKGKGVTKGQPDRSAVRRRFGI